MSIKKFHEIFELEVAAITERRKKYDRPSIILEQEDQERDGTPVLRPTPDSKLIGLALSGGGIRSSAFCLGAMQALDTRGLIDKIDYLSTVSGGGYIGMSMTAAMSTGAAGKFPFASELRTGEVPGVQHIRDHSNYLFPQGLLNIFGNIVGLSARLVANVVLLLPWLLLAAVFTIWANPNVGASNKYQVAGLFAESADFGLLLCTDAQRALGFRHPSGAVGAVAVDAVGSQYLRRWSWRPVVWYPVCRHSRALHSANCSLGCSRDVQDRELA